MATVVPTPDQIPETPFIPIEKGLPELTGEYLVLLPTDNDPEDIEQGIEAEYYVTSAAYFHDHQTFWTALEAIEEALVESGGNYSRRTVRSATDVTERVVAWGYMPGPSNYKSVAGYR